MCLVALALGQSPRFPLVLASNRDEFHDRPTARLDWWVPPSGGEALLSGRDLRAGGTWFGVTARGRLALVTNVRAPIAPRTSAPSRGELVPRWLATDVSFEAFWSGVSDPGYNGFNLVAADVARNDWAWISNLGSRPRRLAAGLYGLSNAALDTPWPKAARLKRALHEALADCDSKGSTEELAQRLFAALADRRIAPDAELPSTGISLDRERLLSAAFIRTPDGRYGTRCSTLLIVERTKGGGGSIAHLLELEFNADGLAGTLRRTRLLDWPPAPSAAALAEPIDETPWPAQAGAERRP